MPSWAHDNLTPKPAVVDTVCGSIIPSYKVVDCPCGISVRWQWPFSVLKHRSPVACPTPAEGSPADRDTANVGFAQYSTIQTPGLWSRNEYTSTYQLSRNLGFYHVSSTSLRLSSEGLDEYRGLLMRPNMYSRWSYIGNIGLPTTDRRSSLSHYCILELKTSQGPNIYKPSEHESSLHTALSLYTYI